MIGIQIANITQLLRKYEDRPRDVIGAVSTAIKKSVYLLERASKEALTTGWTRAIRTGRLRAETKVQDVQPLKGSVYSNVNYAVYVHEGTYKMRERPYFRVAADKSRPDIKRIFEGEISKVL